MTRENEAAAATVVVHYYYVFAYDPERWVKYATLERDPLATESNRQRDY